MRFLCLGPSRCRAQRGAMTFPCRSSGAAAPTTASHDLRAAHPGAESGDGGQGAGAALRQAPADRRRVTCGHGLLCASAMSSPRPRPPPQGAAHWLAIRRSAFIACAYSSARRRRSMAASALINRPAWRKPAGARRPERRRRAVPASVRPVQRLVTVVNVFASWCVPCAVAPLFLMGRRGQARRIVGINYRDFRRKTRRFRSLRQSLCGRRRGLLRPAGIEWGVHGVPETFVIGRDETSRSKAHVGPLTTENIDTVLRAEIEKRPRKGAREARYRGASSRQTVEISQWKQAAGMFGRRSLRTRRQMIPELGHYALIPRSAWRWCNPSCRWSAPGPAIRDDGCRLSRPPLRPVPAGRAVVRAR